MMVDQIEQIIKENERAVVYFYRPGCPYCDYIDPLVSQIEDQYADVVTFTSVDISDHADLLKDKYDFQTVPTIIYFLRGNPVARHGSRDQEITYADMEEILTSAFGLDG